MSNLPGIAGSLEVTSSVGLPCVISASMYSGSSDGPRLRLPSSESASEPDADAEGDRLSAAGGGDFLRDDEAAAVVDFRFGFGFVADVVLVLSFALDLGAEVEGPSPGDARGRGGLKGSRRRFWAGWRSAGMLLAGFCCKEHSLLAFEKGLDLLRWLAMACFRGTIDRQSGFFPFWV